MTETARQNLELGVIGNGAVAALVDENAEIVWFCLPRLDGAPIFDSLLGGAGQFRVSLVDQCAAHQSYRRNTGVLQTVLEAKDGSAIEIVDFAPRFIDRGRTFRPASIVRRVRPLRGLPRIKVELAAVGTDGGRLSATRGVSHLSFGGAQPFRVTTDAPIAYVGAETPFVLERETTFVLGPDESLSDAPCDISRSWMERTETEWRRWASRLATPPQWQAAVIRAAITLKMCVYEETGGIVAALTTSLPEHADSGRNWDYRFCWLRDAFFTVGALNRLAAMGTLERYISYLRNVVVDAKGGHIQPVYGIALEADLSETIATHLPGYRGMGPVRFGNQAAEHVQHDVYGHVVMAASQAFFDERLSALAGPLEFEQFEAVGERAYAVHDTPDAGIWEYRGRAQIHTSSAIMCWAACDRLAKIAPRVGRADRVSYWASRADEIKTLILKRAWSEKRQAFTGAYGDDALDASVLLMAEIGFLPADDPRFIATVDRIDKELREGPHVYRYRREDDFGQPRTAFSACSFWHVEALARCGRNDEACEMFEELLACRTKLGLFSEDVDTVTGELWGNIPQTYCMVGVINAASRLSRPWDWVV
ncbi:MAG: glycoside hydrolase family 15 protein [Parvularculaceae bacterium]